MRAFDSAYLRLTGWYVAIIMVISLLFSFWVYNQARSELRFGLDKVMTTGNYELKGTVIEALPGSYSTFVEQRLDDSRNRLILRLVFLNGLVLLVGAGASYWLARRTMAPIKNAMESQERFTADASHELRTPLAAMKTEIEVGLRDKKLSKDDTIALLKSNLEEINHLSGLAEGLLALTQSDKPLALDSIHVKDVIEKVTKRLQPLANTKNIAFNFDLRPVVTESNAETLDKILGILLDNAIKYSPNNSTITICSRKVDGRSILEIIDQGIGIKASELPHIFDRFYRTDSSRSKLHVSGYGLGLSIAQKLAEAIGATISATSTPGKGSIFTIEL